jgi:hypothetical protein
MAGSTQMDRAAFGALTLNPFFIFLILGPRMRPQKVLGDLIYLTAA